VGAKELLTPDALNGRARRRWPLAVCELGKQPKAFGRINAHALTLGPPASCVPLRSDADINGNGAPISEITPGMGVVQLLSPSISN
jgi:hypothetical protein